MPLRMQYHMGRSKDYVGHQAEIDEGGAGVKRSQHVFGRQMGIGAIDMGRKKTKGDRTKEGRRDLREET
jgi:hypothetical protein